MPRRATPAPRRPPPPWRSTGRAEALFASLPDACILTDPARRIVAVNPAFTRLFGWAASEVTGRSAALLYAFPEDYADQGRRRFHPAAAPDDDWYTVLYRRKDGTLLQALSLARPIRSAGGDLRGFLSHVRDQAAEHRFELTARLERSRYRDLFEAVPTAVAVYRAVDGGDDFVFTDLNPAAARIEGVAREAVLGRRVTEVFPGVER